MKFIVASDNHGMQTPIDEILRKHVDVDAFFHCGDSELPASLLDRFICVCGNNDYVVDFPDWRIVQIENHRIFITHGHRFLYFGRIDLLVRKAKEEHCRFVFFGHTHTFFYQEMDGIHIINPGSISHNRDGSKPSYAIVEIVDDQVLVERVNCKNKFHIE